MENTSPSVFQEIDRMATVQALSEDDEFALKATIVQRLEDNGVRSVELKRIVGPKEEIYRLAAADDDLPQELAHRVSRLAHIISLAESVFGKREKAFIWLRSKNESLNNKTPIDLLDHESGARIVEEALMRIEYGVIA